MYGFEGEVKAKYTAQMFQLFTEVFNYLPLAHCINNKVLVSFYLFICDTFLFILFRLCMVDYLVKMMLH